MYSNDDRVVLGTAGTGLLLVCLTATIIYAWLARAPLPEETVRIVPAGALLAYNSDENHAPLVLRRGDGRLELVALRLDWRHLMGRHVPAWALDNSAIGLPGTSDPATLFVLGCAAVDEICDDDVTLTGQINAGNIAFVEVAVDGDWRRFFIQSPAFIKHLPDGIRIGDVRWLDGDHRVVWSLDRDEDGRIDPLLPGEMHPNPNSRFSGQG